MDEGEVVVTVGVEIEGGEMLWELEGEAAGGVNVDLLLLDVRGIVRCEE